jgi:hypothetical protein
MVDLKPLAEANTFGQVAMTALTGSDQMLVYSSYDLVLRQWTVEIDLHRKRLRRFRQWFGFWIKTVVDCPFDDCVAVGTAEYNSDGHMTYGAYFKLKDGSWHAIPTRANSFEAAASVIRQVSAATGIPRLDIKYS